jgi:hypothetical protein
MEKALRLALEALEMFCEHGAILRPIEIRNAIKAALEVKDEPWEQFYPEMGKPYGFEASIYSNARMKVDVVTGNVSIGTVKKPCGLECDCTDVCKQEAKDEPVALKPCAYESKEKKMCRKCGQVHAEAIWDTTPPQQEAKDEPDYKALWQQMCERCDELDKKLAQRKPLTDEEILTYRHMIDWTAEWSYINFARAIEAAHGIKG